MTLVQLPRGRLAAQTSGGKASALRGATPAVRGTVMVEFRACVRLALLAIAPVTVLLAGAAQAAIVTMTYDGVIRTGFGRTSLFGRPATELVGFDYRAVYRFDTEVGRYNVGDTFESVSGDITVGAPSPVVGATLTVNGVTLDLLGDRAGQASTARTPTFSRVTSRAVHNPDPDGFVVRSELYHDIVTTRPDSGVTTRFNQPFVFEISPLDTIEQAFFEYRETVNPDTRCCSTFFNLTPQRVTVGSAVPEPTPWAAMVSGFGLLGAVLRRRARSAPLEVR